MKNVKRLVTFILLIVMCLSSTISFAVSEKEQNAANQLNAYGILKGRDNGDLALESTITRAEIATLVLRVTAQEDVTVDGLDTVNQSDIIGHWGEENIRKVIKLGYMKGYDENTFGPNDNISYQEVITLMLRLIGEEKDLEGAWPIGQIEKAKKIKLVKDETVFEANRYPEKLNRGTVSLILFDTMTLNTNVYE